VSDLRISRGQDFVSGASLFYAQSPTAASGSTPSKPARLLNFLAPYKRFTLYNFWCCCRGESTAAPDFYSYTFSMFFFKDMSLVAKKLSERYF
jgi:hypothetical protein